MSHISTIRTRMTQRDHVRSALKDLGFAVQEDVPVIVHFQGEERSRQIQADFAVFVTGPGDILILKTGPVFDVNADWEVLSGITKDSFLGRLTQRYAYHVTKSQLDSQGFDLR